MNQSIDRYLSLIAERPDLIRPVASYPVVTDRDTLIEFARKTGLEVGVVCDNGVYWKVLADVIRGRNDTLYRYMRVVPTQKTAVLW